jgi:hypothetical protein
MPGGWVFRFQGPARKEGATNGRNYDGSWTEWSTLVGAPIVNLNAATPAAIPACQSAWTKVRVACTGGKGRVKVVLAIRDSTVNGGAVAKW